MIPATERPKLRKCRDETADISAYKFVKKLTYTCGLGVLYLLDYNTPKTVSYKHNGPLTLLQLDIFSNMDILYVERLCRILVLTCSCWRCCNNSFKNRLAHSRRLVLTARSFQSDL